MIQKYTKVPCVHDTTGSSYDIQYFDYHPLSTLEIIELLEESLWSENPSSQQVRLCQGIRGYKCPREIDGDVVKKEILVSNIFLDGLDRKFWTRQERQRLFEILCSAQQMKRTYYEFVVNGATCKIYSQGIYLGRVWISAMGEIEVAYANTDYLPIDDAVKHINSKVEIKWEVGETA